MKHAYLTCKAWEQKRRTGEKTTPIETPFTSSMFPTYLPSQKTILFPSFSELVTNGNKKFESSTETAEDQVFYNRAHSAVYPPDATWHTESALFSFAITDESSGKEVPITDFKATLDNSASFKAVYVFVYSRDPDTETLYYTEYIYSFAAVENKLPLKPWTILGVVERILDIAEPIYSDGVNTPVAHPRYIVDPDQRDWLEYEDKEKKALRLAPEFTMTRCTLREQLQVVGSYIHAEPRLIHKTVDGVDRYCIHFDPYGETIQSPAKGYPYVFRRRMQSINQYCTSVSSITENMTTSTKWARGAVVHPWSGSGLSTRCATEHVRVTDTNGFAPTGFPVQRIVKVLAGAWNRSTGKWAVGMTDITSYVVEATAYNANLSSYGGVYPYSKSYAIYYTMGQKNLQGLFFREPTASQVSMKCWAIVNILASVSDWNANDLQKEMEKRPFDFVFQINYDPIYSSHVAHGKQDIDHDAVDYSLISNQTENLIETAYYGENLKGIAARMGEVEEIRTGYLQKIEDLPKVGQMIDNMAISSVSYEVRPNGIKYTMSLTKNFNRISRYIGVNSEKRLYEVSERQAYKRTIILREYGVFKIGSKYKGKQGIFGNQTIYDVENAFAPTGGTMGKADHVFARLSSKDMQEAYRLVQLPVSAYPLGNVAAYSWSYADNYSAGSRVAPQSPAGEVNAYQTEVPYCDYYGRGWWYEFAVQQYKGEDPDTSTADYLAIDRAMDLPATRKTWADAKGGALFGTDIGRLLVRKDSREALAFTAQLEFKSDTQGLVIGSGIAQRLPSITGTQSGTARIYFLPDPINKFEMRKLMSDDVPSVEVKVDYGTKSTKNGGKVPDLTVLLISAAGKIPASADGCQSWVIAAPPKNGATVTYQDDDGNVYTNTNIEGGEVLLAMNTPIVGGTTFPAIYFTLVHTIFK